MLQQLDIMKPLLKQTQKKKLKIALSMYNDGAMNNYEDELVPIEVEEKMMNDVNDLYDVIQSGLALAELSIVYFDKDGMIVCDKIKDNDYRIKITEEAN